MSFDAPLHPDPAEAWRMEKEKDGYRPFCDFEASEHRIPLPQDTYVIATAIWVWYKAGNYSVRLVGVQYRSNGSVIGPFTKAGVCYGWLNFRKAMHVYGHQLPFFKWQWNGPAR